MIVISVLLTVSDGSFAFLAMHELHLAMTFVQQQTHPIFQAMLWLSVHQMDIVVWPRSISRRNPWPVIDGNRLRPLLAGPITKYTSAVNAFEIYSSTMSR